MRIFIFGDSITQGFYDRRGGWTNRLIAHSMKTAIESEFLVDTTIFNLSISGESSLDVLQ